MWSTKRGITGIPVAAAVACLCLASFQPVAAQNQAPAVLFLDIPSGPQTGGENNNGIYVSIFGRGFGPSRGTSRVTINGVEVAAYKYWGPATSGVAGLQQISVQPGPNVSSGPVKVTVGGVDSNTDQTFTVRSYASKIWFVSQSGNQGTCVANDITKPCRSVHDTLNSKVSAGDFIVIRGGNWTDTDGGGTWFEYKPGGGDRCTPPECSAPSDRPFAIMGYPGEPVVYDGDRTGCPTVMKNWESDGGNEVRREGFWLTNFNITTCTQATIRLGRSSSTIWDDHARFINMGITGQGCSATGTISISKGDFVRIYGIRYVGDGVAACTDTLAHAVYFSKRTHDAEIAFSEWYNFGGGGVIQARASDWRNEPVGVDYHSHIRVHDNILHNPPTLGIAFAQSSGIGMKIYNNVIYNSGHGSFSGRSGIRLRDGDHTSDEPNMEIEIYNNTIYDFGGGGDEGCLDLGSPNGPEFLTFTNNICVSTVGSQRYVSVSAVSQESQDNTVASHNVWYGGASGTVPSWLQDATDINVDPGFVDPTSPVRDFHLQANSPLIDAGIAVPVFRDLEANPRPQGSGYEVGAYEWRSTGPPDTEQPSAPTSLSSNALSISQIDLSWTAATDNVAVTSYTVLRGSSGGGPYTAIGSTSSTSYSDTGLAASTTYHYVVRAADAAGNASGNSNEASATTQAPVVPEPPTGLAAD